METNCFDDWSDRELLTLFCSGAAMELVAEHKLSHTAILSFPLLSQDGVVMYEELLETGYHPSKKDVKTFVKYLRSVSGRDIQSKCSSSSVQ